MGNIWYRGEAIDDDPATPGSTSPHDLGDGMYLTDNQNSAKAYAQLRSPDLDDQRVYSVLIDRSSVRVLDLTTDLRWQNHVRSVENLIKQANENYGRTFEGFVKAFKIDLSQYDAIIGVDYVRGGRQMCLLYKNGRPTEFHVRIRRSFQPLTPETMRARSPLPEFHLPTRSVRVRLSSLIEDARGPLLEMAQVILITLFQMWLDRQMQKRLIADGLKDVELQIKEKLKELKPEIASTQLTLDEGEKAFCVVTVEVAYWNMTLGAGHADYEEPVVSLADILIMSKAMNSDHSFERTESRRAAQPGQRHQIDQIIRSFEVQVFSDEELRKFKDLTAEYRSYRLKDRWDPNNPVSIAEEHRLRQQILRGYGKDVGY